MPKRILPLLLLLIISLILLSCDQEPEPEMEELKSTSIEGATLEIGKDIDEERFILEPSTTFKANEDIYFRYHNNRPFGEDRVIVQLIDSSNENVLGEHDYTEQLDQEDLYFTDRVYFGAPGRFMIAVSVAGEIRASRELMID